MTSKDKNLLKYALISMCILAIDTSSLIEVQAGTITFTEQSSTVLTCNAGTVHYVGPDVWTWTGPQGGTLSFFEAPTIFQAAWTEPASEPNEYNTIVAAAGGTDSLTIKSDIFFSSPPSDPTWANAGTGYTNTETASHLLIETLPLKGSWEAFDLQFIDNAASSEAPEAGNTRLLLLIGLGGLLGFGRWQRRRAVD
jgi:MYXO-CTERM domain-containing protein